MQKTIVCSVLAFAVVSAVAFSQSTETKTGESKSAKKSSGALLQPQMEPTNGWQTQGELGNKGDSAWTQTTVGASVDGKPLPGKSATVQGEIIDLSCYLQLGKHGDKHASCGKKCLTSGQPIGLLTKAGDIYMLMDEEHDPRRDGQTTFRKTATDNFAKVMTVTGTETTVRGIKAIYVQGYVNK